MKTFHSLAGLFGRGTVLDRGRVNSRPLPTADLSRTPGSAKQKGGS